MRNSVLWEIGRRARQLREEKGLTQAELARSAGLEREAVTRLESGSSNPTVGLLARIAFALDATLADLVSGIVLDAAAARQLKPASKSRKPASGPAAKA